MSDFIDIVGTSLSNAQIAERYRIDEEDIEDILLDENIERCKGCGWWFESGDLTPDPDTEGEDDDLVGYCQDCRKELC